MNFLNCMNNIEAILNALSAVRVPAIPGEYDIHAEIAQALTSAGIAYEHEYRIAPRARIDFYVDGIGIEVKKGKPVRSALIAQLRRYLQNDQIRQMIVISQRSVSLPDTLCGKPLTVFALDRLWGVALP